MDVRAVQPAEGRATLREGPTTQLEVEGVATHGVRADCTPLGARQPRIVAARAQAASKDNSTIRPARGWILTTKTLVLRWCAGLLKLDSVTKVGPCPRLALVASLKFSRGILHCQWFDHRRAEEKTVAPDPPRALPTQSDVEHQQPRPISELRAVLSVHRGRARGLQNHSLWHRRVVPGAEPVLTASPVRRPPRWFSKSS